MSRKSKKLHQVAITSSLAGIVAPPKRGAYCMTKAGINRYMEAMRVEMIGDRIDINLICPGPIDITNNSHQSFGDSVDAELESREGGQLSKMGLERCVELYTTALQYSLIESWISQNPALILAYCRQYLPMLLGPMEKLIGPKYAKD